MQVIPSVLSAGLRPSVCAAQASREDRARGAHSEQILVPNGQPKTDAYARRLLTLAEFNHVLTTLGVLRYHFNDVAKDMMRTRGDWKSRHSLWWWLGVIMRLTKEDVDGVLSCSLSSLVSDLQSNHKVVFSEFFVKVPLFYCDKWTL
jgi:hypothetical protein